MKRKLQNAYSLTEYAGAKRTPERSFTASLMDLTASAVVVLLAFDAGLYELGSGQSSRSRAPNDVPRVASIPRIGRNPMKEILDLVPPQSFRQHRLRIPSDPCPPLSTNRLANCANISWDTNCIY